MVKMFRLVRNREEQYDVRGRLNPPVPIKAGSRIALRSCNVDLAESNEQETFVIDGANNTFDVNGVIVTLTAGEYTLEQLIQQESVQMSLVAGINGVHTNRGQDYRVKKTEDKLVFVKQETSLEEIDWADWSVLEGNPNVATDGEITGDGGSGVNFLLGQYNCPQSSFVYQHKVKVLGEADIGITDEAGDLLFGVGLETGTNNHTWTAFGVTSDTWATGGTRVAQVDDVVTMKRAGNTVTYQVVDSAGATQLTQTYTVTYANQLAIFNDAAHNWSITLNGSTTASGATFKCDTMAYTVIDDPRLFTSDLTTLEITFNSDSLAIINGFPSAASYKDKGSPAEVKAPGPPKGNYRYAGIIMTVDPFILETYDSDGREPTAKGRANILEVLTNLTNFGTRATISNPYPVPLNMKLEQDTTINEISVAFRERANGAKLKLVGDTIVTLLIYEPGENNI